MLMLNLAGHASASTVVPSDLLWDRPSLQWRI